MNETFKKRFLAELRHHLLGWKTKILNDFSQTEFDRELTTLRADPVYPKFHLATPEYVIVRLVGRVSISIGRRLGEIYDKIPRMVAQSRFGLEKSEVAPRMGKELELDICIPFGRIQGQDRDHVHVVCAKYSIRDAAPCQGLGIEIRYNFNPNDSARLRKDEKMANLLRESGLVPIYLVFAENSPRGEAIQRLGRAGWHFVVGRPALAFISDLLETDVGAVLDVPEVSEEIRLAMKETMTHMYSFIGAKIIGSHRVSAGRSAPERAGAN